MSVGEIVGVVWCLNGAIVLGATGYYWARHPEAESLKNADITTLALLIVMAPILLPVMVGGLIADWRKARNRLSFIKPESDPQ